jgi:hypothetical protein
LPMSERSEDVLNHIQIMASWRITCEDKSDHHRFLTRNNLLDPKIIPNEDKVPLPNGTNAAMINQNSYNLI